jgi:hypothetical protein
MINTKRKRIIKATKVPIETIKDDLNTPVPTIGVPVVLSEDEAALYKKAENPLGGPHKD